MDFIKISRQGFAVNYIIAIIVALIVSSRGWGAQPDSGSNDAAMRSEIDQLKSRINVLEAEKSPTTIPVTNPSGLPTLPIVAGYDPNVGFVIRSSVGQFSFHPGFVIDVRNMTSYREKLSPTSGSEVPTPRYSTQNGFDITRFRMTFDGNFTKSINYFVQLQDDQGTSFGLLDAYITYRFSPTFPLAIKVGQFKDPIWHERNLSEANLLAVDRSLLEFLVGGGQTARVQGIVPRCTIRTGSAASSP